MTIWPPLSAGLMTMCWLLPNVLIICNCSWLMLCVLCGRGRQCVSASRIVLISCVISGVDVAMCGSQVDGPVNRTGSRPRLPRKWSMILIRLWKAWRSALISGRVRSLGVGMNDKHFSSSSSCAAVGEKTAERLVIFERWGVVMQL